MAMSMVMPMAIKLARLILNLHAEYISGALSDVPDRFLLSQGGAEFRSHTAAQILALTRRRRFSRPFFFFRSGRSGGAEPPQQNLATLIV